MNETGIVIRTDEGVAFNITICEFLEVEGAPVLRRSTSRLVALLGAPAEIDEHEAGGGDVATSFLEWHDLRFRADGGRVAPGSRLRR